MPALTAHAYRATNDAGRAGWQAGVSANRVSSMEAGRNIAFENVVRIAMVLGRGKELEELFKPQLTTLEDLRRYEESTIRQRIKERTLAE